MGKINTIIMHKKLYSLIAISTLLISESAFAFEVNSNLSIQAKTLQDLSIDEDNQIRLLSDSIALDSVYASPDYENDDTTFILTGDRFLKNWQFDSNYLERLIPGMNTQSSIKLAFVGDYKNSGTIIAYNEESAAITYNKGESWSSFDTKVAEPIHEINFSPGFQTNHQLYIVTDSGLNRKGMDSSDPQIVLENDTEGNITHVGAPKDSSAQSVFYVTKGTKILKTENYGSSWFEYDFGDNIRDFYITPAGDSSGDPIIITENNKIFRYASQMDFYEIDIPAGASIIYDFDFSDFNTETFLMSTDAGVFISYDIGQTWTKLNYSIEDFSKVTDVEIVNDGVSYSIYLIYDGILYRDTFMQGTLLEYMNGIETSTSYVSEGSAISKNILDLYPDKFDPAYVVKSATLFADGDLNGQSMTFYMAADGVSFEEVTLEEAHEFTNPGTDLRWKAELSTQDPNVTPVLNQVIVDFGMEEGEGTCAGFSDVPASDPTCPAISYVKAQGIFEGYPDGTFQADREINRAETVKVIVEGFDYSILAEDGTNLGFSDVEIGQWYMKYLRTAFEGGIIEGYPDGTFRPAEVVNYVEMMKIFLETADADVADPAEGEEWYQGYTDYAAANDLVVYEEMDAGMARGDVAELFYKWSQL